MDVRDARARLIVAALPEPGATVRITGGEAKHGRARRLAPGDSAVLLDGSGRRAIADVLRVSREETILKVKEILRREPRSEPISLFIAGLRPERIAWAVEKATELDVARIVIVQSERTQAFRAASAALSRLERVARESSKQSGRADWPTVSGPVELEEVLRNERSEHRLFVDFGADRFPRRLSAAATAVAVGPEGGWAEAERRSASDCGWKIVSLPAGTLRAETAAIAALTLLHAAMDR